MKKSQLKNIIRESIKELMTEQQTVNGGNCNGKIELPGSNYHHVEGFIQEIIDIYGPTADFRDYAGKSDYAACSDFTTVCCVTDNFGNPDPQDKIWIHNPTVKDLSTGIIYHTWQDIVNLLNSNGANVNPSSFFLPDGPNLQGNYWQITGIGYCNNCTQEIGCTDPTASNFCSTCTSDNGSCEYRRKPVLNPIYKRK